MKVLLENILSYKPLDLSSSMNKSAAVSLIINSIDNPEILLIRRKQRPGDPWSGQIAFPGGMTEKNESHLEAAIRETREEIGLDLSCAEYYGAIDDLQSRSRRGFLPFYIRPHVFKYIKETSISTEKINHDEVDCAFWISFEFLLQEKNKTSFIYSMEETQLTLPGINLPTGDILWGMTYKILNQFFEITNCLSRSE